jgi:hypothetical protein
LTAPARTLWIPASLLLLVACASTPAQEATAKLTAATADVRVTNDPAPAVARVGQTIGYPPPIATTTWLLEYNHDALQLIVPAKDGDAPGTGGWVWRARQPGTFEVTVTQHVECKTPPCAPNVARFAFTLQINKLPDPTR